MDKEDAISNGNLIYILALTSTAMALISAVLVGCSHKLSLNLSPSEPLMLSLHAHGTQTNSCSIVPGAPRYQELEGWLARNRDGWEYTPATYVPAKVVSGTSFTLNFFDTIVIANYSGGQYSHHTTPADHEFLECE